MDVDFLTDNISSNMGWLVSQIILAGILLVFYWYAGGRDFFKKTFNYHGVLPLSVIFDCTAAECEMLYQLNEKLLIGEFEGREYISPVLYAKIFSSEHKILEKLASKHYVNKIELVPIIELERVINQIEPKQVEMDRGFQYYLIGTKLTQAIAKISTRKNDFLDDYIEICWSFGV